MAPNTFFLTIGGVSVTGGSPSAAGIPRPRWQVGGERATAMSGVTAGTAEASFEKRVLYVAIVASFIAFLMVQWSTLPYRPSAGTRWRAWRSSNGSWMPTC